MEIEEWRSLAAFGFTNYAVSSYGRIMNLSRYCVLHGSDHGGYIRVGLFDTEGKQKMRLIHVLVASAFYGVQEGKVVDHINRVRSDNRLSNLRWVSNSINNLNRSAYKHRGSAVCQYDVQGCPPQKMG